MGDAYALPSGYAGKKAAEAGAVVHNSSMLLLQAKQINIDKQSIVATDGDRDFYVFIPKTTPMRVPQEGEFLIAENKGRQLVLEGVAESEGAIKTPGAWNLSCRSLDIRVGGQGAWIPLRPGWSF